MLLELNLVRSRELNLDYFTLISRQRYSIENDSDTMQAVINFIGQNIDIISSSMRSSNLPEALKNVQSMNIDEFMSLKYTLNSRCNLDILMWCVADSEINPQGLKDGTIEYNIYDEMYGTTMNTRLSSKIEASATTMDLAKLYGKINEMYGLFEGPIFESESNPITKDLESLKLIGELTGDLPKNITMHINDILRFLGKRIIVISNE